MTVQELFREADFEVVYNAYVLMCVSNCSMRLYGIKDDARCITDNKKNMRKVFNYMKTCKIEEAEKHTVFVQEYDSSYDESEVLIPGIFSCRDSEIQNKLDDIHIVGWEDDYIEWLNKDDEYYTSTKLYSLHAVSFRVLAGYTIAQESIEEQGVDACCGCILSNLLVWGGTMKDRNEYLKDIRKEIYSKFDTESKRRNDPIESLDYELSLDYYKDIEFSEHEKNIIREKHYNRVDTVTSEFLRRKYNCKGANYCPIVYFKM